MQGINITSHSTNRSIYILDGLVNVSFQKKSTVCEHFKNCSTYISIEAVGQATGKAGQCPRNRPLRRGNCQSSKCERDENCPGRKKCCGE